MATDSEQLEEDEAVEEQEPVEGRNGASSIALTLTLVSLVLWFGFQAFQLVRDRSSLQVVKANQETAMQESEKIRTQFQTLMAKTAELANKGHAGAKMVIDELQKRGLGVGAGPEEKPAEKPDTKAKTK
jgi:hypothetical protein